MRRSAIAILLVTCGLAACASPVHLGGEYRRRDPALVGQGGVHTIYEEDRWTFFWGIFDSGKVDAEWTLNNKLRDGECFTDVEVADHSTPDGILIGWLTAGIVGHREVVVKGRKAVKRAGEEGAWEKTPSSSERSSE